MNWAVKSKKERVPALFLYLFWSLAIVSNLAQYKLGGPWFGGMSGVVYDGYWAMFGLRADLTPETAYLSIKQPLYYARLVCLFVVPDMG